MQLKIDCKLVLDTDDQRDIAASLKVGDVLRVVPDQEASQVTFITRQGQQLAQQQQQHSDASAKLLQLCRTACKGTLRTLRRDAALGQVAELTVRVLPGEPAPALVQQGSGAVAGGTVAGAQGKGEGQQGEKEKEEGAQQQEQQQRQWEPPPVIDELDEEQAALRLCRGRLEALAASPELRSHLHNRQLQDVIRQVDASSNREQALERALVNPEFSAFCTKMLDVVAPPDQQGNA